MKVVIRISPQIKSAIIAVCSGNIKTGIRNVSATKSFAANVEIVASQTCLWLLLLEASCEIWMPSASENASEIATVRIPAMIASLEVVAAFSPMMTPRVVMTPEVRPNARPVFMEGFIVWRAKLGLRVLGF